MKILHITNTDPAGAAYNMIRAINEHTEHRARLISTQALPGFDFPRDILDLYDSGDEIASLLESADVIHFHKINELFSIEYKVNDGQRFFHLKDFVKGKKVVYHIHGAPSERNFPKDTAEFYAERKATVLCSTPDLEQMYREFYPAVRYFPNCVPIKDVRYLPRACDDMITGTDGQTKRYVVFQSGTHSLLKNMHIIREVMEKLAVELPVFFLHTSPDKIQTQDFALRHKRIAHIVFDHIEGYYGLSSLEALSMAKPTIAGLNEYCMSAISAFFGIPIDSLPWVIARTKEEIEMEIRTLIHDNDRRKKVGDAGRKFMEEVWSDAIIARRLADFYQAL